MLEVYAGDRSPQHRVGEEFIVECVFPWEDRGEGLCQCTERDSRGGTVGTVGRFQVLRAGPVPEAMHDAVAHPPHYTSHPSGIECIEITKHHNFCVGNVIKYCWRAGLKGETEGAGMLKDLRKARQYLDFEIARIEKEQGSK